MIIYFSGGDVAGVWQRVNELLLERGAARLLSFAYSRLLLDYCALVAQRGVRAKVMIDSEHSRHGRRATRSISISSATS